MDNDIKTWLFDILQSINEIDGYITDKPKSFKNYSSDIKTKRAVYTFATNSVTSFGVYYSHLNLKPI